MKKLSVILMIVCCMVILGGCQKQSMTTLPTNPIVFQQHDYSNPSNTQDEYAAITYNGREYIMYGTLKGRISNNDIAQCLGYLDLNGSTSVHICTLVADPKEDFLIMIEEEGVMSQPSFYRAVDTIGQTLTTPNYIDDLDYDIWK